MKAEKRERQEKISLARRRRLAIDLVLRKNHRSSIALCLRCDVLSLVSRLYACSAAAFCTVLVAPFGNSEVPSCDEKVTKKENRRRKSMYNDKTSRTGD